jgi:hypothetical protein
MNNGLNIYYDKSVTDLIETHLKTLSDYESILWEKIKKLDHISKQDRVTIFREDPVRLQIEKQIAKIQEMSFPIRIEIVDYNKEK